MAKNNLTELQLQSIKRLFILGIRPIDIAREIDTSIGTILYHTRPIENKKLPLHTVESLLPNDYLNTIGLA